MPATRDIPISDEELAKEILSILKPEGSTGFTLNVLFSRALSSEFLKDKLLLKGVRGDSSEIRYALNLLLETGKLSFKGFDVDEGVIHPTFDIEF